jgi:hypothetical protein
MAKKTAGSKRGSPGSKRGSPPANSPKKHKFAKKVGTIAAIALFIRYALIPLIFIFLFIIILIIWFILFLSGVVGDKGSGTKSEENYIKLNNNFIEESECNLEEVDHNNENYNEYLLLK